MKNLFVTGLLASSILLFSVNTLANSNPFYEYINTDKEQIDIDRDGTPDILRKYKGDKLKKMVFRSSKNPESWKSVSINDKGVSTTRFYENDQLVKKEEETLFNNGYKLDIVTYGKAKQRTIKKILGNSITTTVYSWNNKWEIAKQSHEIAQAVNRESTIINASSVSAPVAAAAAPVVQYRSEAEPVGFRLDSSCNADRAKYVEITHYFFKSLLPCLHSYHPDLAWELANNIRRHKTVLKCDYEGMGAYTFPIRNAGIHLSQSHVVGPAGLRNGALGVRLNEDQITNSIANTIMHEAIHNLGIVHKEGGHGRVDPAYGCETLCSNWAQQYPGLMMLDFQTGCRECLNTRVSGKLPGNMNRCNSQRNI